MAAKLIEYGGDPLLVGPRAAGLRRAAGPELGLSLIHISEPTRPY